MHWGCGQRVTSSLNMLTCLVHQVKGLIIALETGVPAPVHMLDHSTQICTHAFAILCGECSSRLNVCHTGCFSYLTRKSTAALMVPIRSRCRLLPGGVW